MVEPCGSGSGSGFGVRVMISMVRLVCERPQPSSGPPKQGKPMMEPCGVGMGKLRMEGRKVARARSIWWMGAMADKAWSREVRVEGSEECNRSRKRELRADRTVAR